MLSTYRLKFSFRIVLLFLSISLNCFAIESSSATTPLFTQESQVFAKKFFPTFSTASLGIRYESSAKKPTLVLQRYFQANKSAYSHGSSLILQQSQLFPFQLDTLHLDRENSKAYFHGTLQSSAYSVFSAQELSDFELLQKFGLNSYFATSNTKILNAVHSIIRILSQPRTIHIYGDLKPNRFRYYLTTVAPFTSSSKTQVTQQEIWNRLRVFGGTKITRNKNQPAVKIKRLVGEPLANSINFSRLTHSFENDITQPLLSHIAAPFHVLQNPEIFRKLIPYYAIIFNTLRELHPTTDFQRYYTTVLYRQFHQHLGQLYYSFSEQLQFARLYSKQLDMYTKSLSLFFVEYLKTLSSMQSSLVKSIPIALKVGKSKLHYVQYFKSNTVPRARLLLSKGFKPDALALLYTVDYASKNRQIRVQQQRFQTRQQALEMLRATAYNSFQYFLTFDKRIAEKKDVQIQPVVVFQYEYITTSLTLTNLQAVLLQLARHLNTLPTN